MITNYKSKDSERLFVAIVLGLAACTAVIAQPSQGLHFSSSLQINQDPGMVRVLVSDEEMIYLLHLSAFKVFPGSFLRGIFRIENRTDDTLKISPQGQALLQYLSLEYTSQGDTLQSTLKVPYRYVENIYSYPDTTLPTWAQASSLPPHAFSQLDAICSWDQLSKLPPGLAEFQWSYDNSIAILQDSTLTMASYRGRLIPFNLTLQPENRADSIYYLNRLAKVANSKGDFARSLDLCQQILALDSNNFRALETSADVLWKMARFSKAISFAMRGKKLVENAADSLRARGILVTYDDAGHWIDRMQFLIDKCQKREKWKGVK
jgi:tetratricopeptide (TPR) repeat protein